MHCSAQPLSLLTLFIIQASSNAFLTINNRQKLVAPSCNYKVESLGRRTLLHQSLDGDDDGASTINIALITSTITDGNQHELQSILKDSPFCKMTGTRLTIADVPSAKWSQVHVDRLGQADIVCFESVSAVRSYLNNLDENYLNVPNDMSDEDRRKLPNTPEGMEPTIGASVMAACPNANTGRECLNSGRWATNHIYYPKSTQQVVELKAEPIEGLDGGDKSAGEEEVDEVEDIDMSFWADSVLQASGDVMERKFWGGGW